MDTLQESLALPKREGRRTLLPKLPAFPTVWRRYFSGVLASFGLLLVLTMVTIAVFAHLLAPADPWRSVAAPLQPPNAAHRLGTDDLGRDLLSGLIYAMRTSLLVSVSATALSTVIGVVLGIVSGYKGNLIDDALMRLTEFFQIIPRFFLALLAVALFKPGLVTITLVLGLTSWPMTARLMRAQTLSVRERDYVMAAQALGAGNRLILWQHILPNCMTPIIVHTSLMVGQVMLVEAALAFLGLGDPNHISLGYLLRNAQPFLRVAWWMFLFPGLAIGLAVLGFNLLGDSLNDRRMRRR